LTGAPGKFYQIQELKVDELWQLIRDFDARDFVMAVSSYPMETELKQN
jgi:hypothetical protein